MSRFVLSQLARSDLGEIWLYIVADDPEAAETLINTFCERLFCSVNIAKLGKREISYSGACEVFRLGTI